MKRLSIILVLALVMALAPFSLTFSQDAEPSYIFGGAEYDNLEGFGTTVGYAFNLGGDVWMMPRGVITESGAADITLAYITKHRKLRLGLIAAPGVNWVGTEDLVAYITGSAGGLIGFLDDSSHLGLFASGTYKAGADGYKDGWQLGFWLIKGI